MNRRPGSRIVGARGPQSRGPRNAFGPPTGHLAWRVLERPGPFLPLSGPPRACCSPPLYQYSFIRTLADTCAPWHFHSFFLASAEASRPGDAQAGPVQEHDIRHGSPTSAARLASASWNPHKNRDNNSWPRCSHARSWRLIPWIPDAVCSKESKNLDSS
jgi:hypothetical protein